jgi:hypothetical protein
MAPKKSTSEVPDVVEAYVRLASAATTDNQFRSVVSSMETRLCPRGWAELVAHVQTKASPTARVRTSIGTWFSRGTSSVDLARRKNLERELILESDNVLSHRNVDEVPAFERVLNLGGVSHFVHPRNKSQSVLFVWTGIARRPMMALRHFLQAVWQCDVDVLVLRARPMKRDYADGVSFFGDTLDSTIDGLRDYSAQHGYTRVFVAGMSMGTPPAMFSAPRLGASSCLLAGPMDPRHNYGEEFQLFDRFVEDAQDLPRFATVVGEFAPEDAVVARFVSSVVNNVELVSPGADHNPLWPLQQRGELADWLRINLFSNADSRS